MHQHQHRVTNRGKTVITIAAVILGVLALLGVIQFALSGNTPAAQPVTTTTTTSTSAGAAEGALGLDTTEPSVEAKVTTGSWRQQRGMLTVEVTRVEVAGGRVSLEVSATNASTARMTMPVTGIAVLDNQNRTYPASRSKWEGLLTQGGRTSGTIVLDERISVDVTTLTLTFSQISGQFAPTGAAISVAGIPVPR